MKQKVKYIFCTLKINLKEDSFQASNIWKELKAQNAQEIAPYLEAEDQAPNVKGYGKYVINIQKQFVNFLQFMKKKLDKS
ncbi:hypothetical protein DF185_00360 [Marinifilum breve]|uniref:Uncharacterized protein n=1 Tax=Marinifilum breve TaxID=2184082 RepID=A0A2V4A1T6_9BACT|nr:hypothetical protein [Marinifilum breve]PXY02581.1 hypothetical protein DF185_00360 [Marinifilum breve]